MQILNSILNYKSVYRVQVMERVRVGWGGSDKDVEGWGQPLQTLLFIEGFALVETRFSIADSFVAGFR